jgi:tetratricopeptide (TPR) repeat protein
MDRLEAEHDNLWAAMSWLAGHGPLEQAVHLSMVTGRFWWLRGHAAEYARLGDDLVAGSKDLPPYQHALALTQAGSAFATNGDLARAQQLFEQSLPLYRQDSERPAGTVTMNAQVLVALGHLAGLRHDYAGAGKLLDEGQALLRELRDGDLGGYDRFQQQLTLALADDVLGQVRLAQGDNDAAARLFTDGLAVARRVQDWISLLVSLYDLALATQAQGDLAGAAGHLQEGLALAAQAGDETSAAYYLEVLAAVAGQQGNPQRAVRLLAAARSILDTRGSGWLGAFVAPAPPGDAVLAALRSRIGDAAFEQAQAWGRSAGTKRAVEYALQKP